MQKIHQFYTISGLIHVKLEETSPSPFFDSVYINSYQKHTNTPFLCVSNPSLIDYEKIITSSSCGIAHVYSALENLPLRIL